MSIPKGVFDSSLLIRHDVGDMPNINRRFAENEQNKAHFASSLLIYDQIIIPTHDFGIIGALLEWYSRKILLEMLETNALKFIRTHDLIGYAGNGLGVCGYKIQEGEVGQKFNWWQTALFCDNAVALEAQLNNPGLAVPIAMRPELVRKILPHCTECVIPHDDFEKCIKKETYLEIINSAELKETIRRLLPSETRIDLKKLPSIETNQLCTGIRENIFEPVDVVLGVAEFHRDLVMASKFNQADIFLPDGIQSILTQKLSRFQKNLLIEGFLKILDLNGLPNVESALLEGKTNVNALWQLRTNKDSIEFRKWLHGAAIDDSRELERLYVSSLNKETWINHFLPKSLRFVLTSAVSWLSPEAGSLMGIADTFFVEKLMQGYSPKIFINELKQLFRNSI